MIWIFYLLMGIYTLSIFYKSKEFWHLSFLLILVTSYIGMTSLFIRLPFTVKFLIFITDLVATLYFLYCLNKDYKKKKIELRREKRREKEKSN